ncbi:ATP-binding protein [Streptomyces sannanensis]|uniref:ATP-binding protein n=1 Tax=Streptomyces sannanensis TaxID=285536 RepID=A0ABP6SDN9_9ACTN
MDPDPYDDRPRLPNRSVQLSYDYSLFAPGDATAPKVCRDFVRGALLALGRDGLALPATLCTSELVTNVHLHTKGTAMLRLQVKPIRVRVSVFDESPDLPVPRMAGDCWGRGLALVDGIADSWGVADDRGGRYAKGVWFELGGLEGC